MKNRSIFVVVSAAVVACGEAVPLGALDQPVDGGDAGGVSISAWEIEPCEDPSGTIHEYTSIADVQAHITGVWHLCSGALVWSPADTAGIELGATEAHYLVESGSTLVRGSSPEHDDDISIVLSADGSYRLTFERAFHHIPVNNYDVRTSEDGRFLELSNRTSGNRARYVRVKPTAP